MALNKSLLEKELIELLENPSTKEKFASGFADAFERYVKSGKVLTENVESIQTSSLKSQIQSVSINNIGAIQFETALSSGLTSSFSTVIMSVGVGTSVLTTPPVYTTLIGSLSSVDVTSEEVAKKLTTIIDTQTKLALFTYTTLVIPPVTTVVPFV